MCTSKAIWNNNNELFLKPRIDLSRNFSTFSIPRRSHLSRFSFKYKYAVKQVQYYRQISRISIPVARGLKITAITKLTGVIYVAIGVLSRKMEENK